MPDNYIYEDDRIVEATWQISYGLASIFDELRIANNLAAIRMQLDASQKMYEEQGFMPKPIKELLKEHGEYVTSISTRDKETEQKKGEE